MTTEDVCRHEAGHAAAATLLGLMVRLVDTTARTEPTPGGGLCIVYGSVHYREVITDRDSARRRMVVILCGPMESANGWDDLPHWPLDEHADTTDERNLWALCDWLDLEERDYRKVMLEAIELTLTNEYRIPHTAVTGMLDNTPRIDAALFERVREIARKH
jgi:hypothetical protein